MITNIEQRKLREAQQTERDLAEKVNLAQVDQIKHMFLKDMEVLRARLPNQAHAAREAALDKKYAGDRQKILRNGALGIFSSHTFFWGPVTQFELLVFSLGPVSQF